jgi:hypothetical protein
MVSIKFKAKGGKGNTTPKKWQNSTLWPYRYHLCWITWASLFFSAATPNFKIKSWLRHWPVCTNGLQCMKLNESSGWNVNVGERTPLDGTDNLTKHMQFTQEQWWSISFHTNNAVTSACFHTVGSTKQLSLDRLDGQVFASAMPSDGALSR